IKDTLQSNKFTVTSLSGGFEALNKLTTEGADIVIAATQLADLSGYMLSCLIKSNDNMSCLPVVLVDVDASQDSPFWSKASQADSIMSLNDLGKDKLVALVNKLVDAAGQQGWTGQALVSKTTRDFSANLTASYQQLAGDLLIERLVGRLTRLAMKVIEPRKKFVDNYFVLLGGLFNFPVMGLVLASTHTPWAAFQMQQALNKKSFDDMARRLTRELEIHKELSVDISGELQEPGGKTISSVEVLPVKSDKATLGALVFGLTQKQTLDDATQATMAQLQLHMQPVMRLLLANQEIESLYQREQYRASTDPLTGLYNLEFLVGFLQQQLLFSYRQRSPVGLLIVDIDNLKNINDEFGYEIGDLVLSTIANRLLNQIRGSDLVARYGGDEFAVVAPNTDLNGIKVLAEKIRLEIEQMSFVKGPGRKGPHVTVSVGCAGFNMEDLNPETILRDTKLALQRAKDAGRNRVAS
ncbi:MAG: diguanylate cyclase, partial [Candidatus Melainabacteria bacterium]|nr:diguanylate cyclase [Candidatus Melainabacteria bacterium]